MRFERDGRTIRSHFLLCFPIYDNAEQSGGLEVADGAGVGAAACNGFMNNARGLIPSMPAITLHYVH